MPFYQAVSIHFAARYVTSATTPAMTTAEHKAAWAIGYQCVTSNLSKVNVNADR